METIQELQKIIHEKAYQKNLYGGCGERSLILQRALAQKGIQSQMIRYKVKGEKDKSSNEGKKLMVNGLWHISHVVLLVENQIVDCNYPTTFTRESYEDKLRKESEYEIESEFYNHDDIIVDDYAQRHGLSALI